MNKYHYRMILIIALLISTTMATQQEIRITSLNFDTGFTAIKQETVDVIENYNKIYHVISFRDYDDVIEKLQSSINRFSEIFDNNRTTENLFFSVQTIRNKLNTIKPMKIRRKRGLLNAVGLGMNYLFGVMDDDDKKELEEHLKVIEHNNHNAIETSNKQITINDQMQRNILELARKLNQNQNLMHDMFINSTEMQKKNYEAIETMQIQFDINYLNNEIEKIQDLIAFSRIGILGRNILTNKEINKYDVDNRKLKYLKSTVFEINRNLIIGIMIPEFTEDNYYKILILPIPTSIKKEIFLTKTEYIINNNSIYDFNNGINEKKTLKLSNKCVQNLIKHKYENCTKIENVNAQIIELEKGMIITKNLGKTTVKQDCNNIQYEIQGNNYIEFKNCTIELNGNVYDNAENVVIDSLVLPFYEIMNVSMEIHSLEKVNLKNMENVKHINELKYSHSVNTGISISITMMILIIAAFLILLVRKQKVMKIKLRNEIPTVIMSELQEKFQSKEGGVSHSHSPHPPPIEPIHEPNKPKQSPLYQQMHQPLRIQNYPQMQQTLTKSPSITLLTPRLL